MEDRIWPALSGSLLIHICPCISSFFFIYYGYFNSIQIVKFRTIEGFIDCIVLLRVLEILSKDKKKSCRKYHWALNGCPWVLGSRCYYWKKLCGARSTLLEAYMVNSHVEPTHKCNNMKEKMLLYQINIVILRWLLKH